MSETETTPTEVIVKTPLERANADLQSVKNFFLAQEKRYVLNPTRLAILKTINERLASLVISEETANELVSIANEFSGQRSVKWTDAVIKFATPKSYAASELRDKVDAMQNGLGKLLYKKVLDNVLAWTDIDIALPCPMVNCRTNEFVKTELNKDGLFYACCTNPKHFRIETQTGTTTEGEAIVEWNKLIQSAQ